MFNYSHIEPIDYLVIGHISEDITPNGISLGGTVSYAALTAKAMGRRVGIVTACKDGTDLSKLQGIPIRIAPSDSTTVFKNLIANDGKRIQHVYCIASSIDTVHVPETWKTTPIVHLGPLVQEIDPNLVRSFPQSFLCITPQGWLREWNNEGEIRLAEWPEAHYVLGKADAAVISIEDMGYSEDRIEELVSSIKVLAVTEGKEGVRIYWNSDLRSFSPPQHELIDSTGAGDIFAASFFIRLYDTQNPWEAARFANQVAAKSITRMGLNSIPTHDELNTYLMEIIQDN